MDLVAVRQAAGNAIEAIREDGKPRFLECRTYRFRAHSMFDAQLYRDQAEVQRWRERDPITQFTARLKEAQAVDDARLAELEAAAEAQVTQAVTFAESGTWEPAADLLRFVHSEVVA